MGPVVSRAAAAAAPPPTRPRTPRTVGTPVLRRVRPPAGHPGVVHGVPAGCEQVRAALHMRPLGDVPLAVHLGPALPRAQRLRQRLRVHVLARLRQLQDHRVHTDRAAPGVEGVAQRGVQFVGGPQPADGRRLGGLDGLQGGQHARRVGPLRCRPAPPAELRAAGGDRGELHVHDELRGGFPVEEFQRERPVVDQHRQFQPGGGGPQGVQGQGRPGAADVRPDGEDR